MWVVVKYLTAKVIKNENIKKIRGNLNYDNGFKAERDQSEHSMNE
jgi:hypothetical protein